MPLIVKGTANTVLPCSLWMEFTMGFVTKATPINYVDKCHIKKLKSRKTCLIGYSGFISHEWFTSCEYIHDCIIATICS